MFVTQIKTLIIIGKIGFVLFKNYKFSKISLKIWS
jgi:hypothetical protein